MFTLLILTIWVHLGLAGMGGGEKPNVLFIAVDDLRPELGCYGIDQIQSPNIDRLASQGTVFANAYCNVPVCGASRASLLMGMRPTESRFVGFDAYAQDDAPGKASLPGYFKDHGYYTLSNGKVFHHIDDMLSSWSEAPWNPAAGPDGPLNYLLPANIHPADPNKKRGYPFEVADVADDAYFDGQIANKAIADLRRLKNEENPFFMALGFLKPHLPFNAPKRYWDLYPSDSVRLAENDYIPRNAPPQAIHNYGELRHYSGIPMDGPVPEPMARQLVRGYYACVSYVDAQIGRVLAVLEELGLADNTIVVLWGDHGWQLGEHALWCKHANFKTSLRAPLIVRAPQKNAGQQTDALVEFVDIYASLCDLARLGKPAHLQGTSFAPVLDHPELPGKQAVFSRFVAGETIKTHQYAYTEWFDKQGNEVARMLYDHTEDPGENNNIADANEMQTVVRDLHRQLAQHKQQRK